MIKIERKERMVGVHFRLPSRVRKEVKAIAQKQQVSESEVYRHAIEFALPKIATKCSNNSIQDVTKGGEPS